MGQPIGLQSQDLPPRTPRKTLGNGLYQHLLGALGVLGGSEYDFAVCLGNGNFCISDDGESDTINFQ